MSNLQTRIISAVVLAVAVLGITWAGGFLFRLLAAAIVIAIFFEWIRMARPASGGAWRDGGLGLLPEALMFVFAAGLLITTQAMSLIALATILVVVLAVAAILLKSGRWDVGGLAYAALSGLSLALLREDGTAGLYAIIFLFAVVWATDILAYFVGRAVGVQSPPHRFLRARTRAVRWAEWPEASLPVWLSSLLLVPGMSGC